MKTQRTPFTVTAVTSFAMLGLGLSVVSLQAQTPVTWGQNAPTSIRLATSESDRFSLAQLVGKPVRGANQEQLSEIADFLIVAETGQVQFALVPSGGGASGQTYRLVPVTAVDPAAGGEGITLRLNREQWDKVGTVTEAEVPARFTMSTDHLQRLAGQFTVSGHAAPDVGAKGELVRASALKGQAVRSGNDASGTVDDVAIDLRRQTAAAVVKSASGFTGQEQRYLVPIAQLKRAEGNAGLVTTLGRTEFAQAQSGPTGFGSAPFTGQSGRAQHAAVQQAVAQVAGARVQVVPEMKLVLRGTVDSDAKRSDAERAATQAAPGVAIENQIQVQR